MSSPTAMICFNPDCKNSKSNWWRKGWRLRNSGFANLCDRCGSIYEEGRFCETFHKYASGWRSCETCGKRVHCGCVVSVHAFAVLDAGGIECTVCTRKKPIVTPNPMWPPRPLPGWLTECSTRNCSQTGGSGSPRPWQHAVNLFNNSAAYSDLESRPCSEAVISTGFERLVWSDRLAAFPPERNQTRNLSFSNGSLKHSGSERLEYGTSVFSREEEIRSCLANRGHQFLQKDGQSALHSGLAFTSALASRAGNHPKVSRVHSQKLKPQAVVGKQLTTDSHNGIDYSHQTCMHNYKPVDVSAQKDLLPRYCPKISDDGLQKITVNSNSAITPLFEKMLSVSDAGRVGRLVLPKKCAESYFPPISQPEGLPLKVQDIKGKEWIFQFRFWPNNNSRMYVLEGITNCIQSLQLQAGDVVTFSRIEPEGKLIMGFRKASNGSHSEQVRQAVENGRETPAVGDVDNQKPKRNEDDIKVKEASGAGLPVPSKRKNCVLNSKRKRSRANNVDLLELKVTLEEVQGLFRSPAEHALHVEIIDDFEFEEYEDAPVIGRPTIIAKDSLGEDVQWAQCDDCLKWRKLPFNYILPARWTCSENLWNPDRSSCDAAQELTREQLTAASEMLQQDALVPEALEAFARLAIEEDNESCPGSAQPTTKHPRHKPGCSCIVCVQPPSGKNPKHPPNCTCNVCMMVKRRFRTMMLRRERNKSAKEAATREHNARENVQASSKSDPRVELSGISSTGCANTDEQVISNSTKAQIDLNIQPERDEEASTCCHSKGIKKMTQTAAERGICNSGDKIHPNDNQHDSRASSLCCDKKNVAESHKNSDNKSIVELPPMLHPSTSTSTSR